MGPGSGDKGGEIIAFGTPEEIAAQKTATGVALGSALHGEHVTPSEEKAKISCCDAVIVKGARQNNLKQISVEIPHNQMTVICGPSGAGKSSLAFETIYAEGQRRYVDSLSPYIRQFVKQCPKPQIESIEGLSPAVAIEQRLYTFNPRSTVGTMTEVYDYLRLLFSRIGIPHCPKTGYEIKAINKELVVERICQLPEGEKLHILAPIDVRRADAFGDNIERYRRLGFLRIRLNKVYYELSDENIPFNAKQKNEFLLVVDRFKADPSQKLRALEAVSTAVKISGGTLIVARPEEDIFFNLAFSVEETGESYPEITPHTFAFNTPQGMCPECQGLGVLLGVDMTAIDELQGKDRYELLSMCWNRAYSTAWNLFASDLDRKLDDEEFMNGSKKPIPVRFEGSLFRITFQGFNPAVSEAIKHERDETDILPEEWLDALSENRCPSCKGSRLNALASHVTLEGKSIVELCDMPLDKLKEFIDNLKIAPAADLTLKQVYSELENRLDFLNRLGLSYISLNRAAPTLSGGEAQRARLSRQIGSGLTGVLYVLDEPTTGLHPHDSKTVLDALDTLKARKNTLLVVEHDPQFIEHADNIIELGPGSGRFGGRVVKTEKEKRKGKKKERVEFQVAKKPAKDVLFIKDASIHNLKRFSCKIPIGQFSCISGVSGSGKSTLLFDVIAKDFSKLEGHDLFSKFVIIDQKPRSQNIRSDVASYVDVLTPLRQFFSSLPEARARGLQPKHFSCFHRKGMCTNCYGFGYKKVELYFLPPVKIPCPECHGLRLNPQSLGINYGGKNLGQILKMTADEAHELFQVHPKVKRILEALQAVGLGYVTLGQEVTTLSSGEAQRLKLAYQLAKRPKGDALYLIDEPTAGLHRDEAKNIIRLLHELVDKGHTVIAVEHNLDAIISAHHVIDLGPGAGVHGGKIVFEGHPQELLAHPTSKTAEFLRKTFTTLLPRQVKI
jgi:excinuclease ABC subunit A